VDPPALAVFVRRRWTPDLRLALLLCLPAAAVAIGLRLWLLYYMPGAFAHDDTAQILLTPERLIERGSFDIHSKRTFLTPILYTIAALLHIPVAYFASIVQHIFGVILVFVVGLIAMAWFKSWRFWIVPLTVIVAIDPVLLWYEHVTLAESLTVFGVALVALAGTFFYRQPNRYTLALLFLALLFAAGARPEGRYFCIFAVTLIIRRLWGDWRALRIYAGLTAVWTFLIFAITRTGQSGILLYASMIQFSPDHLLSAPGLAERMEPYKVIAARQWASGKPRHTELRKAMSPAIEAFLQERGVTKGKGEEVNEISKLAGAEIAIRNFWRLPGYVIKKFFIAHREPPALGFTEFPHIGQVKALFDKENGKEAARHSALLWGAPLTTRDETMAFMQDKYDVTPGKILTPLLDWFVQVGLYPLVPMVFLGSPLRGIPWLYAFAFLGAILLVLRERPRFGFQLIWFLFLVGIVCTVILTGNVRARYRLILEPFWYIYLFALIDTLINTLAVSAVTGYLLVLSTKLRRSGFIAFIKSKMLPCVMSRSGAPA
jgi:hypothetical protein